MYGRPSGTSIKPSTGSNRRVTIIQRQNPPITNLIFGGAESGTLPSRPRPLCRDSTAAGISLAEGLRLRRNPIMTNVDLTAGRSRASVTGPSQADTSISGRTESGTSLVAYRRFYHYRISIAMSEANAVDIAPSNSLEDSMLNCLELLPVRDSTSEKYRTEKNALTLASQLTITTKIENESSRGICYGVNRILQWPHLKSRYEGDSVAGFCLERLMTCTPEGTVFLTLLSGADFLYQFVLHPQDIWVRQFERQHPSARDPHMRGSYISACSECHTPTLSIQYQDGNGGTRSNLNYFYLETEHPFLYFVCG
ncbi:hypothetical protein MUK42_37193 [Musa troglodytarum]|uniref:Uncharacterized protein n=1 Tax=Musa troglodytarum TaxID=320322 RepID=A0A9E7EBB9_9LILI|nr:hypothetical protein MUK42_37193 [Musa troglodytarum]